MNAFMRRLLSTRLEPASSIIRSTGCRVSISSRLRPILRAQQYASFRPNPPSEDEQSQQERAAELIALRRRAAQAKREARYYNLPISWKPLFVGLGMCVAAFLAAEAIDGRADARAFEVLQKSGWRSGTIQNAKKIIAANTVSPLTLIDHSLGTDTVRWWATRSDGEHATLIIIATNAVVFLAWGLASRVPALSYRMGRSFMHFPGVTPSYTLLTSVFSHQVRKGSAKQSTLFPRGVFGASAQSSLLALLALQLRSHVLSGYSSLIDLQFICLGLKTSPVTGMRQSS